LEEMVAKGYSRFSYDLQLNKAGLITCLHEVMLRYNRKSIPLLAKADTTCQAESLWAQVTKYSQGKRLNQNYSELWEVGVGMAVLCKSDPAQYIRSLFRQHLGLKESGIQSEFRQRREQRRQKKRMHKDSENGQAAKRQRKIVKSNMGKKGSADRLYKPEKV